MHLVRSKKPSAALVVALLALFVALGGTAGAVVTAAVPLAKRAIVADNAKKLGGQTAAQVAAKGAAAALAQSPAGARPAASAVSLVTRKTAPATIAAGAAAPYTIACDSGQKILGGGFASDGPLVVAVASGPTDDVTWSIGLLNLDDSAGHNINLYATCIS